VEHAEFHDFSSLAGAVLIIGANEPKRNPRSTGGEPNRAAALGLTVDRAASLADILSHLAALIQAELYSTV
jgi:ABC-type molybdate transport system substrate-binding protein